MKVLATSRLLHSDVYPCFSPLSELTEGALQALSGHGVHPLGERVEQRVVVLRKVVIQQLHPSPQDIQHSASRARAHRSQVSFSAHARTPC
jgi:hypothetical protein